MRMTMHRMDHAPESAHASRLRALTPLVAALLAVTAASCSSDKVGLLPKLNVDPARVSVAGLSSGAYMATQAQLAYPEHFHGAALVAGGPYGCAAGKLDQALATCMKGTPIPDAGALAAQARQRAGQGQIGALKDLAGDKIYVLHGKQDTTVAEPVAHAAAEFYEILRASVPELADLSVTWDAQRNFAHTLPTTASGSSCDRSEAPYLGKCAFDAAGAIFAALYGDPPRRATTADGELRRFDQNALRPAGKDAFLADSGYVYVPRACREGKPCGVMVAFHGCQQNAESVGESFVRDSGFNRWGDVYNVAVLYPQTRASYAPLNPKACWDWWGYSGSDYDSRNGVQLRWLVNALGAVSAQPR
jgi:poly(3-hydroxybutyrate) depolymerase